MEIQKQSFSSQQNFKGFHVLDTKAQKSLLTSLNSKQLNTLSGYVKEQESNSVHILLTSAKGNRLKASLFCPYRIKDMKTDYKQIPVFESKFHFIKRVVKIADKYKQQIKGFKVLKLNWAYSMLPEWKNKMKV